MAPSAHEDYREASNRCSGSFSVSVGLLAVSSKGLLGSLAYYLHQCMLPLQSRDVVSQGVLGPAAGCVPLPAPLPFFSLINDVTDLHVESPVLAPQGPIGSSLWKTQTKTWQG